MDKKVVLMLILVASLVSMINLKYIVTCENAFANFYKNKTGLKS